jgi:type IV pilus assembly protein PilB
VEINLPGINQVNVNPKTGLTFAEALRAFLRQDPDIIMVGEIRDLETAEIAIKAAQTGHLVLSTLHTNSAAETITRLPTWACRRSTSPRRSA